MMLNAVIYLFGGLAALATLLMLFTRKPVKAALLMLTALLSTAGIYLALSAQLLAALQVILYAGAIMTLFIVALSAMSPLREDKSPLIGEPASRGGSAHSRSGDLSSRSGDLSSRSGDLSSRSGDKTTGLPAGERTWRGQPALLRTLGLAVAAVLLAELMTVTSSVKAVNLASGFSETGALAIAGELFGRFMFQFELLSLIILSAIVGAAVLAAKRSGGQ